MDPAAVKYLNDLESKQPECVSVYTKEAIEVFVDGERYLFNELEFDNAARAINEKLMYQYRVSELCDEVQFFGKKVVLTPKELAVHEKYYCHTYDGHFDIRTQEKLCSLTMFVDDYEYTPIVKKCNGNKCDTMYCFYNDCNALIRPSLSPKGELVYFKKPHSSEFAHSHCSIEAPAPMETIDAKNLVTKPKDKPARLNAEDLTDAHFTHEWLLAGRNRRQLLEPETGYMYTDKCIERGNISYWDCSKRRKSGCVGRAFGKFIDGKHMFASDGVNVHNHHPVNKKWTIPKNTNIQFESWICHH